MQNKSPCQCVHYSNGHFTQSFVRSIKILFYSHVLSWYSADCQNKNIIEGAKHGGKIKS